MILLSPSSGERWVWPSCMDFDWGDPTDVESWLVGDETVKLPDACWSEWIISLFHIIIYKLRAISWSFIHGDKPFKKVSMKADVFHPLSAAKLLNSVTKSQTCRLPWQRDIRAQVASPTGETIWNTCDRVFVNRCTDSHIGNLWLLSAVTQTFTRSVRWEMINTTFTHSIGHIGVWNAKCNWHWVMKARQSPGHSQV